MNNKIIIFLSILWIIISYLKKKKINKEGISRYNFIQKNTIGYWLAISLAMYISKIKYFNYKYTPIFYI